MKFFGLCKRKKRIPSREPITIDFAKPVPELVLKAAGYYKQWACGLEVSVWYASTTSLPYAVLYIDEDGNVFKKIN